MTQIQDQVRRSGANEDLSARIRSLAGDLKSSLEPVVDRVAGSDVRPIILAKELGIDNSLVSRLLRAIRSPDPLATVREIPAPHGLRIFLDASMQHGVDEILRERAEASVRQFESLIGEFPNGRAALDTAISGWLPEVRQRGERTSKQAVYKAMSQMLGYQIDTMISTAILAPSAHGKRCDMVYLACKSGLRRLRAGSPIFIFGMHKPPEGQGPHGPDSTQQWTETLSGERQQLDLQSYLLEEFSSPDLPQMRVVERDDMIGFLLDRNSPAINKPVSLAIGEVFRNAHLLYQENGQTTDLHLTMPRIPSRVLVKDFLIHKDVYPGYEPSIIPRLHGMSIERSGRKDPELIEMDRIDLAMPVSMMGWGIEQIGLKEQSRYVDMLGHAMDQVGWRPENFRVYRSRVMYPVPFVSLSTWFELPTLSEA